MKKTGKIVISVILVLAVVLGTLAALWYPLGDTQGNYLEKYYANGHFENSLTTALPQTKIYSIIKNHFDSPLAEGKTVKKAIVIGYDGCRIDVLTNINNKKDGAINRIIGDGGKMYVSYCGGVPFPQINTQDTSTAPGWCSMLTGCLADEHGITGNYIIKSNDHLTLLTTLVEDKTIDSSSFYVSWKGHFESKNGTYVDEVKYTQDKKLNVNFVWSKNDKGTSSKVLEDVGKKDCSDFIFSILEYCDHSGHATGFYTSNPLYKNAFKNADATAQQIIEKIYARDTFDTEDWLIVLTTDHGGINNAHGGASIQERYTFIALNKPELIA